MITHVEGAFPRVGGKPARPPSCPSLRPLPPPPQVLCSVPDVRGVLAEAARVLKPGGTLLFIEHTSAQSVRLLGVLEACGCRRCACPPPHQPHAQMARCLPPPPPQNRRAGRYCGARSACWSLCNACWRTTATSRGTPCPSSRSGLAAAAAAAAAEWRRGGSASTAPRSSRPTWRAWRGWAAAAAAAAALEKPESLKPAAPLPARAPTPSLLRAQREC